jgi:hypothetical protein
MLWCFLHYWTSGERTQEKPTHFTYDGHSRNFRIEISNQHTFLYRLKEPSRKLHRTHCKSPWNWNLIRRCGLLVFLTKLAVSAFGSWLWRFFAASCYRFKDADLTTYQFPVKFWYMAGEAVDKEVHSFLKTWKQSHVLWDHSFVRTAHSCCNSIAAIISAQCAPERCLGRCCGRCFEIL